MATIATQYASQAGTPITFTNASSGGDQFAGLDSPEVIVRNNHATDPRTVTFTVQKTVAAGLAISNRTVTVTAAEDFRRITLDPAYFCDANGNVQMTYSDSGADIQIAVCG